MYWNDIEMSIVQANVKIDPVAFRGQFQNIYKSKDRDAHALHQPILHHQGPRMVHAQSSRNKRAPNLPVRQYMKEELPSVPAPEQREYFLHRAPQYL